MEEGIIGTSTYLKESGEESNGSKSDGEDEEGVSYVFERMAAHNRNPNNCDRSPDE